MSGCYRCGLPEGGPERLCETCFRLRFHRGPAGVEQIPSQPIDGIELSPKTNRLILIGGAILYFAVVGLFSVAMGHPRVQVDYRGVEFVFDRESVYSPEQGKAFGSIPSPQAWR